MTENRTSVIENIMSQKESKINEKRVVCAPQIACLSTSSSVISVELSNNEEVEWQWTHLPNGQSIVTGYKIVKKNN